MSTFLQLWSTITVFGQLLHFTDVSLNEAAKKQICLTMKDNLCVLDIQIKACQVIINVLPTGETTLLSPFPIVISVLFFKIFQLV